MKRFKKILLVHDSGESGQSTLSRAIDLARRNQASLTVIQVIGQIPRDYRMLVTSVSSEEIMKLASKEHTLLLEKEVAHFPETSRIMCKVVVGREFIEIVKEVLRNKHDLVIKTARGMGGTLGMLFGSTAMHLLRKCPCPVWLIKPYQDQGFHRIMAAVDVEPTRAETRELNHEILELATSLAKMEHSDLHIVHTWKKPDLGYLTAELDYIDHDDISILYNEAKNLHIKWLNEFLERYNDQQYQVHIEEGSAGSTISEFAKQQQVDLIVMGTICRTGIPGFFIGNTAEKILNRIDCSVLAVKPENFISPVKLNEK